MGKSRNRKWYDSYDDDYYDSDKKQNNQDRRKQKRIKNALKSKNYDVQNLSADDDY